jgi:four helix bundle protein
VWQEAMNLAEACYRLTAGFPREQAYGLTSQIRRAGSSIPANIAEGYGRDSKGAYAQFLKIAQGSLKELETHLLLAGRLALVEDSQASPLMALCDVLGRMLRALIRSVEKSVG